MAAYSTLTATDAATIGTRYGLALVDVRPLSGGMTNSSFLALDRSSIPADDPGSTRDEAFIVTVLDDHDVASAVALADLMDHLVTAGLATPTPVRMPDGAAITAWDDKPVMVKHFVAGTLESPLAPRHLPGVGAYLARLHQVAAPPWIPVGGRSLPTDWARQLRDSPSSALNPTLNPKLAEDRGTGTRSSANLASGPGAEGDVVEGDVVEVVEVIASAQDHEPRWRHLPAGLIHGDLFDDNVVIAPDDRIVVLDWETASVEPLVLDLGMAAVGLCRTDDRLDPARLDALVSGYETVRPLGPDEQDGLPAAIEYATAVLVFNRFMRHRIHRPDDDKHDLHRELVAFAHTLTP